MIQYSMMGFFNWYVAEDDRNSSRYTLVVSEEVPCSDGFCFETENNTLDIVSWKLTAFHPERWQN